jgi:uncharacterized damage-inducible protein DinB
MADLQETLLSMIDYDAWAMHRVLDAAEALTSEQLAAPAGSPERTAHQLLVHLNQTFAFWTALLRDQPMPDWSALDVPDVAAIRAWSDDVRGAFRDFVAGLSAADLDREFARRNMTRTWSEMIVQCLQHAIHHRGEIASLLTADGASPGDLDYLFYLRERDAAS